MKWQRIPLGDLAQTGRGSIDPRKWPDEIFDLYSIPAFDNGEPDRIAGGEIGSSKKLVKESDLLLSRIVPHIRRAWVVKRTEGKRLIASGEWMIFRGDDIYPDFLRHVLVCDEFHRQFMSTVSGVGGSLLRARPAQVHEIQIPIPFKNDTPDLEEQKRIAAILDKADGIRRKRREALKLADEFLRSLFLDMFGDPVTNPKGFPVGTIRDLVQTVNYGTSKKSGSEGAFPVIRMGNITYDGNWDFSSLKYTDLDESEQNRYLVHKGEILFNRTNSKELVGKTAVYREDSPMAFAGYLVRAIVNKENSPEYISGYLNSKHGKLTLMSMCKSIVGMANINAQEFQSIRILKAPTKLQVQFADVVKAVQEKKETLKKSFLFSDKLFSSLQQRAFKGKL